MQNSKQKHQITFKFILAALLTLFLSSCSEPTFEEFYVAKMAEIGNDVTGLQVVDRTEGPRYGVAFTASIVDGEIYRGLGAKPYEITSDGWKLHAGTSCSSSWAKLGAGNGYVFCGKINEKIKAASAVLFNDKEAKIIQLLDQRYWYILSDQDHGDIKLVNDNGQALKTYRIKNRH